MPTTRQKAALRRAEGLPPSPQNEEELPRELRGPQRRKNKTTRSTRSTRSTAIPDSEEDPASQQNQEVPAQTLREGNAGGYIRENTSEQQYFLPESQSQPSEPRPEWFNDAKGHYGSDEATTALHVLSESLSVEPGQTPPHSPILPKSSPVPLPHSTVSLFRSILSKGVSTHGKVPSAPLAVVKAMAAVSVSSQTDGQVAATASPIANGIAPEHTTAATQTSPIITRTSPKQISPSSRTISTQTDAPTDRFRPLGLYSFRSELAVPPQSCSMTLHLGDVREIRISKVSPATLDQIKEKLHDRKLVFERNWLTPEEIALGSAAAKDVAAQEAEAAEKLPQTSAKRKRDDEINEIPDARRRRIDPAISPTPLPALSPNPFRLRSRMRRNGGLAGRSHLTNTPVRSALSATNTPAAAESTVRYGRDGSLRLLGASCDSHQQNKSSGEGSVAARESTGKASVAVAATAGDDSDDEGDSEPILEWPQGPYWSVNRNHLSPAINTLSQPVASQIGPDSRHTQDTASGYTEHTPIEEPPEPTVETPEPSGWRLGSILNTARRFLPGIHQRQAPLAAPQTVRPTVHTQDMVDSHIADVSQRGAQTEPRRQDQRTEQAHAEPTSNFAQRLRNSQSATQKTFRTKENIEEMKRVKAEKEQLQAEWAKLEEERKITEQERRDVEDAHRAAYASQQLGSKRPLRPSPRVIPNPKGVSYGLDPAYFDSSDEEDEETAQPTPSRTRPMRKARRINGTDQPQAVRDGGFNDQDRLFSKSVRTSSNDQALQYHGSRFSDSPPNAFDVSAARTKARKEVREDASRTSKSPQDDASDFNHSGHFQLPLSPSSSEEDGAEHMDQETPSAEQSVSLPSNEDSGRAQDSGAQVSRTQDSSATTAVASSHHIETTPMGPPATPEQGPRAVRFAKDLDPSKTLDRERQKLRDQMALLQQGGKLVPSPQDIANSPRKIQLAKPRSQTTISQSSAAGSSLVHQQDDSDGTRVPVDEPLFVEPGTATDKDDFSIRGAASRTSPGPPSLPFTETLSHDISKLHAYQDFQQEVDPSVKELLESSWEAQDDAESASAFQSDFTAFFASEQSEAQSQANPTAVDDESFVDNPDDDEASFYSDDEETGDQALQDGSRTVSFAQLDASGNLLMDPIVAAVLESQWTPEDEAYASDEFKETFAAYKKLSADGQDLGPVTA